MFDDRLPIQLAPLFGREREIGVLSKLLRGADRPPGRVRLVTITGTGGVGKTSLALTVARGVQDAFPGGVFFVSLAVITDTTLVIPTLARALGVAESPSKLLLDSLKEFLRDRQVLLLLDNFEQIISAAPLLSELLSACAALRLLVTSREALRLRGEQEFLLAPLELSRLGPLPEPATVETLLQFPGIALFVQRAQAVLPDFQLTPDNARAVAEICARLDGLPLAIELAAARIKLLPPKTMLARLQESALGLLTGGARDLPARQQTLRSTVQWSYDSLNPLEQRAFRWLAVFAGGCTLEAAETLMGNWSIIGRPPAAPLDVLTSLVDKNLLRQAAIDGEPRLSMLETIRAFGLEELARANEWEAARRAHAGYYLTFAKETEPHLTGKEQKTWLRRLDREQDNLRVALRWSLEQADAGPALQLTAALWRYWMIRGYWSEGRRWLEEALSAQTAAAQSLTALEQAVRAKALYGAGRLGWYQGDMARVRALCEQSVALYRALGDQEGMLGPLMQSCRAAAFQGDWPLVDRLLSETLALAEGIPDSPVKAQTYAEIVAVAQGLKMDRYLAEAGRYLSESERINRAFNNLAGLAYTLAWQGAIAITRGDYARASACYDEAERLAEEIDSPYLFQRLHLNRAALSFFQGDYDSVRKQVEEYIQLGKNMGDLFLARGLYLLAAVFCKQGFWVWAARLYGMADAWFESGEQYRSAEAAGDIFEVYYQRSSVRTEAQARLGEETFAKEWAEGRKMTFDDVLAIPHPPAPGSIIAASSRPQPPVGPAALLSEPLTAREMDVLHLLAQGLSNPQIAGQLVISRRTVDAHLRAIYEKLGVKSRDAAIRAAREKGVMRDEDFSRSK